MGFYGKIYEQAGNIFNRLRFKNTTSSAFPESDLTNEFILRADGGEASAALQAGNKWLQFEKEGDLICNIYHSPSTVANNSIMILQDKEGNVKANNIIGYGDKIIIKSPIFDEAGHIKSYQEKEFQMIVIDNFTTIEEAINDIATLKNNVDAIDVTVADHTTRIEDLEATDTTIQQAVTEANNNAQTALDTVASANEAAANAIEAASQATQATLDALNAVQMTSETLDKQDKTITELSRQLLDLSGRVAALESNS